MKIKHKISTGTNSIVNIRTYDAEAFLKCPVCDHPEFEIIDEAKPHTPGEQIQLNGNRFIKFKCLNCGTVQWKLIEKDVEQLEKF